jgi:hypothetical protein
MGHDFVFAVRPAEDVHRHDDALAAKGSRRLGDERRIVQRHCVDGDLVRPSARPVPNVLKSAYSAAEGQRHEAGLRDFIENLEGRSHRFDFCIVPAEIVGLVS